MLYHQTIAVLLPAYNEAGFITQSLQAIPKYVDYLIPINDGSTDSTWAEIQARKKIDPRIKPIKKPNGGIGSAIKAGVQLGLKLKADYFIFAAGDNQCDFTKIKTFVRYCHQQGYDVCRGNRFADPQSLTAMPKARLIGNALYSLISKFVSGYYSLFDFQSSYSAIPNSFVKRLNWAAIRDDYLYDNSLWIELYFLDARIKEIPIPSLYQGQISNIHYGQFIRRSLPYLSHAFLKRLTLKYLLRFHPIGLFLITGSLLFIFGLCFGLTLIWLSRGPATASTATVMLAVIPFFMGFYLLIQALVLDIQAEPKKF